MAIASANATDAGLVTTAHSGQLGTAGALGHVLRLQPESSCPKEQGWQQVGEADKVRTEGNWGCQAASVRGNVPIP